MEDGGPVCMVGSPLGTVQFGFQVTKRIKRPIVLVSGLWLWAGCSVPHAVNPPTITTWDTVGVIGTSAPDDTLLGRPYRAMFWGPNVVVIDEVDPFVRVFDREGNLLWSRGKRGGGPGEFSPAPLTGHIADDSTLLVMDPGNVRLVEFRPNGQLARELSLSSTGAAGERTRQGGRSYHRDGVSP